MLTVIIVALIGLILGVYIIGVKVRIEATFIFFTCFFGTVIGAIGGAILAIFIGGFAPTEIVLKNEKELVAFKDGHSVSGSFFIGCGSISGHSYYYFYEKTEDGGIKQGNISVDSATLYEENRENGIMKTYFKKIKGNWNLFAAYPEIPEKEVVFKIFIPKGTVIRQFKADLE